MLHWGKVSLFTTSAELFFRMDMKIYGSLWMYVFPFDACHESPLIGLYTPEI